MNSESSVREIMLALLALGPAASEDQVAMRQAVGALLQNPPDKDRLDKAWRQVRGAIEELRAPPPVPSATQSSEAVEANIKDSWALFAAGRHVDPDVLFPDGGDGIVTALRENDRKGEGAAKAALLRSDRGPGIDAASSPVDFWRAVELAALAPADKSDPDNKKSKWDARAAKLKALAPEALDGSGADRGGWLGEMAEARRRLHLGEALGRGFGTPFAEINAELDHAAHVFNQLEQPYGVAMTELVRGRAYAWRGQLMEASEALSAALIGFVRLGNLFRQSDAAYELGVAYRDLHRFEAARHMQARNIELEIQRRQPDTLTRSMQSCAMTHINEARLSPAATRQEKEARSRLLAKARMLASYAFDKTKTRSEKPPEDPAALDFGRETNEILRVIPPIEDDFRASMCARDLSEIALLENQTDLAYAWLERAKLEARALTKPGETMVDAFVMPAFSSLGILEPEQARKRLVEATSFDRVRLAELELRLPSREQRPAMVRANDLDLVARAWDLQKLPTYAIEAWLNAADLVEDKPSADGALSRNASAASHWRHRALLRAETIGASTHAQRGVKSPEILSDAEKAAADEAGVSVLHLIDAREGSRIFRARGFDALGSSRLLVRVPAPAGWSAPAGKASTRQLLEKVSRERAGIPRIDRSGGSGGTAWVVDELVEGPLLVDVMQTNIADKRALLMLSELGDTLQALLATGMGSVKLDINEIVVTPGDKLVLRRYNELFLGASHKSITKIDSDLSVYIAIAERWIGKAYARLMRDIRLYRDKGTYPDEREAISVVAARFREEV